MARIGSVAAAPFVGSEFVSLYVGARRVPTVPGRPVIVAAVQGEETLLSFVAPSDGGSEITQYKVYMDDVLVESESLNETTLVVAGTVGQAGRLSAVNAVGEGPLSAPFVVTAA
jgi:hypothetical protein